MLVDFFILTSTTQVWLYKKHDNLPNSLWLSISSSNAWISGISEISGAGGRNQSIDFPLTGKLHRKQNVNIC